MSDDTEKITQLTLSQAEMADFARDPGRYPNLQTLFVKGAPDCEQIRSLAMVPNLEALYIQDISCDKLPENLRVLKGLKTLSLVLPVNDKTWPAWLSTDFPLLENLTVYGISLETLPADLSGLPSLKTIDLQESPVEEIPESWGSHPVLEEIFISAGNISEQKAERLNVSWTHTTLTLVE